MGGVTHDLRFAFGWGECQSSNGFAASSQRRVKLRAECSIGLVGQREKRGAIFIGTDLISLGFPELETALVKRGGITRI